jgi:hypothetical protein
VPVVPGSAEAAYPPAANEKTQAATPDGHARNARTVPHQCHSMHYQGEPSTCTEYNDSYKRVDAYEFRQIHDK